MRRRRARARAGTSRGSLAALAALAALELLTAASCRGEPRRAAADEAAIAARARAAIGPFKGALKAALGSAMAESLPAAIDVCAKRAPELARQASRDGVTVGRSALRLRNPENAPRSWLAPVIAELAEAPSDSDASKVVSLPDGRAGYAEAIWLGPACLLCHGAAVAPDVSAEIRRRYPNDAATGFAVGDFRGVFWAELDATSPTR